MRNIVKRITTIFLMITLAVVSLQELCYAENGGSASSGGMMYYGTGNPSYPDQLAFPFYNIIVCDKNHNPIINCYVVSKKFENKIDGSSTVMGVADGTNRTMLWEATRTINIVDTIKANGKELVYSGSFESFNSTPLLISGMGWDFVNRTPFKDWSVRDNHVTNENEKGLIPLMKDLDVYSKCNKPEGTTTMPDGQIVDNFEAWLRGYDFNTQQIDQNTTLE